MSCFGAGLHQARQGQWPGVWGRLESQRKRETQLPGLGPHVGRVAILASASRVGWGRPGPDTSDHETGLDQGTRVAPGEAGGTMLQDGAPHPVPVSWGAGKGGGRQGGFLRKGARSRTCTHAPAPACMASPARQGRTRPWVGHRICSWAPLPARRTWGCPAPPREPGPARGEAGVHLASDSRPRLLGMVGGRERERGAL